MEMQYIIASGVTDGDQGGELPGLSMGMSFLWESHGKRPMGWDRHKLLRDGNGTDKHVPWTTLRIAPVTS